MSTCFFFFFITLLDDLPSHAASASADPVHLDRLEKVLQLKAVLEKEKFSGVMLTLRDIYVRFHS